MKKLINIAVLGAGLLVSTNALAQKKFEGVVTYGVEIIGDIDPQQASMLPEETKVKFKGDKSKMVMENMMGSNTIITDGKEKSGVVLLDMMGKQLALKMDDMMKKSEEEMNTENFDVSITSDTKEICGYKCTKAMVKDKKNNIEFPIYFTKDLPSAGGLNSTKFKGIDGFLMEYENDMNGIKTKMTVKKIEKTKVDDSEFSIPKNYKLVTQEELMKEFSGE